MTDAAAALLAVDPLGLGGAVLQGRPGPKRDAWLARFRSALPAQAPWRRLPAGTPMARLLGGLDLAATLAAGRPVAEQGLLAAAHGGVLLLPMAERAEPGTVALLAAALDAGQVAVERDGLALTAPAVFALVALDEALEDETGLAPALADRLAFRVDPEAEPVASAANVAAARTLLPRVAIPDHAVEALTAAALGLGVASVRGELLAVRAARALAALGGRDRVTEADAAQAARLVLAPRATRAPATEEAQPPPPEPPPEAEREESAGDPEAAQPMADRILAAAAAAIPPDLLARLAVAPSRAASAGRAGDAGRDPRRGRVTGSRRGEPRGQRLALLDTLRAAAPWQRLRGRTDGAARIEIRRDDFRIARLKARTGTTAVFVVDASGSAALARLAEAKGAVELLLADCYVRRDRVAVIAFRGRGAELLLPPTGSLVRAKRCLAGLPGGGGTPLAAALDAAAGLTDQLRRGGHAALVVLLTDGRANVARDGIGDRARAGADALAAAAMLRAARVPAVLLDTGARPSDAARKIAEAMGARYLPLPHAGSGAIATVVRAAPR